MSWPVDKRFDHGRKNIVNRRR